LQKRQHAIALPHNALVAMAATSFFHRARLPQSEPGRDTKRVLNAVKLASAEATAAAAAAHPAHTAMWI
jgi:hypothetical protein